MACGCGCNNCDDARGLLGGLMGDVVTQAANFPVIPGARFQFGFNFDSSWNATFASAEDLAPVIEAQGLAYNAISYQVTGFFNLRPFVTIEGQANRYWESALDFCADLRITLEQAGYAPKVTTIQCNVENQSGEQGQAPVITPVVQPGGGGGSGSSGGASSRCNWDQQSLPDYVACEFGIGTAGTLVVGALAVLIAVTVIRR